MGILEACGLLVHTMMSVATLIPTDAKARIVALFPREVELDEYLFSPRKLTSHYSIVSAGRSIYGFSHRDFSTEVSISVDFPKTYVR